MYWREFDIVPTCTYLSRAAEGGKVEKVVVEEDPSQVTVTGAEAILQDL